MVDQVLLSIIRRTYSSILAQQIIGVQPLTSPSGKIFTMRPSSFDFQNAYYKYFLRLNNRRKYQTRLDFEKANYPFIILNNISVIYKSEWKKWMNNSIGEHRYFRIQDRLYFDNKDSIVLYHMMWS